MVIGRMVVVGTVVTLLLLSGCTPVHTYVKTHSETLVDSSRVAMLKPASGIYVTKIDGKPMFLKQNEWRSTEFEVEFLPGLHRVEVGYYDGVMYSTQTIPLVVDLQAGRKYLVKPNEVRKVFSADSWSPEIVDVTDKPECWTVGVWGAPKGC